MADEVPSFGFMHQLSREIFADLGKPQRGIIASVTSLDRALLALALKERVAALFSSVVLFGPNIQNLRGMNAKLRDFLNKKGCNISQHPFRKTINTLADQLYDEAEERAVAVEMTKAIVAAGKCGINLTLPRDTDPDPCPSNMLGECEERIA